MRMPAIAATWLLLAPAALAQPAPHPLAIADPVRDKTLPLLGLIEADRPAAAALTADADLAAIAVAYRARLAKADAECKAVAICYAEAGQLTDEEALRIEAALRRLAAENQAVRRFADGPLRASGVGAKSDALPGADRIAAVWRTTAGMLRSMVSVYGEGGSTRYPSIDAMRADPKAEGFGRRLRTATALMVERHSKPELFLEAPADFALTVMMTDGRDEAGRYEPMALGENRAAFERMKTVNWAAFAYSAIIVPGQGPETPDVHLDPGGRLRLRLALERFKAGKAPLILVSGGHVHPARTPYAEAIEMKHALIKDYGVPEAAIILDPHARYTTTNLRNAVRLLFRYGAPMAKKALVVSDEGQTTSIADPAFDARNQTETGIIPYAAKTQLSRFEMEISPSLDALELNPTDPLDP